MVAPGRAPNNGFARRSQEFLAWEECDREEEWDWEWDWECEWAWEWEYVAVRSM